MNRYNLQSNGIYVERILDKSVLQALADQFHPVVTEKALIRVGGSNDGGYLVPDDLEGVEACFSPGVDDNSSFERDLNERFNIGSHLADGSIQAPPAGYVPLSFTKKYIASTDSESTISMATWVAETAPGESDLIMQMDIEGAEYTSILAMPETLLTRFRIIVIEVHEVEAWGCPAFFGVVREWAKKILRNHACVHLHPNNHDPVINLNGFYVPRVFEATFLRRDRARQYEWATEFPNSLDSPCCERNRELELPKNWFRYRPDWRTRT